MDFESRWISGVFADIKMKERLANQHNATEKRREIKLTFSLSSNFLEFCARNLLAEKYEPPFIYWILLHDKHREKTD